MKYLDLKGLLYYTGKVQTEIDSAKGEVNSALQSHISNKSNPHNVTKDQVGLANVTNDAQVKRSEMGAANGVATLNESGKVPSAQLPSYVDDVLEYDNKSAFPASGEAGKIYIAKDTNLTYRWGGSAYVEISQSLALGETSSTAYAGDKGAANRAAINSLPPTILSDLSKGSHSSDYIGFRIMSHSKSGMSYGEPESDTLIIPAASSKLSGLMTAADKAKLDGIAENANLYVLPAATSSALGGVRIGATGLSAKQYAVQLNSSNQMFVSVPWTDNNTTYSQATSSTLGLVKIGYTENDKNYPVELNENGQMFVNVPWLDTTLPIATTSVLGGIKVGANLSVTPDGTLSAIMPEVPEVESISNTDIDSLFT